MKLQSNKLVLCLALAAILPAKAKLVAWYPLDESQAADATVVENVSGNAPTLIGYNADPDFNLVDRGHPSATAALGTSYLLSKGGALLLGDGAAVQPTDQFTISFFYQPGTFDPYDRILESQLTNTNAQHGIRIDGAAGGNRVRVLIRSNTGGNTQVTHPLNLKNDGTWYFCAVRYDSTLGDGSALKLTVVELNGSTIDEATINTATSSSTTLNTGSLATPHAIQTILGSETIDGSGVNTLNGALDEFAFFDNSDGNGILTDAQLAAGANFGPSGVELITSFTTNQETASVGNPATLSWTINEPFDSLILDDGNGNSTNLTPLTSAGSGSTTVTPASTTTYYLRGTFNDIENVHVIKILAGAAPEITSFTTSSSIVSVGEAIDLTWNVIGADSITLDPGATDVTALTTINQTVNETTTFTLSATNAFGTTTGDVTVTATNGPIPAHSYVAATGANSGSSWVDLIASKNMGVIGLLLDNPITTASPNTTIAGTYLSDVGSAGATVAAFQAPDSTFEIWLRPAELTADHQVIFETGGGQNGLAALITENGLRFIGSAANARTLDLVVPLTDLNLTDFIQLVFSTSADNDTFEVSVKDAFGATVIASETANVILGGNGAVVFSYGTGGIANGENNLGGRTELPDQTPAGLSGFSGEIAILNVYESILTSVEIGAAFTAVAPNVTPQTGELYAVTNITYDGANQATLTWKSLSGITYDAEFSTDLAEWFPLEQPVDATDTETTKSFFVPANQQRFFLRIVTPGP